MEIMALQTTARINVDEAPYNVNTFRGRFKYYAWMTDPRTILLPKSRLLEAKVLLEQYRTGHEPSNTTENDIKYAMKLYSSAFHPDSQELQNVFGRMSFQVPGGMLITGGMLAFYRSVSGVVFWQFINQSFNAIVNYTNRNANSPTTVSQLGVAYVSATLSAVITALGFKSCWTKIASPIFQRYVPFAAVAAANCVNIPLMRQNEIINGIEVKNDNGVVVGHSRLAALKGITQVVVSRIVMAAPGMLILPLIMERIEYVSVYQRMKWINAPFQTVVIGCFLVVMVPTACSLFPQTCSLDTSTIKLVEAELYAKIKRNTAGNISKHVVFNKGL